MWWQERLVIEGPVSAQLLRGVDQAMLIYRSLYPSLALIDVGAPSAELGPPGSRTGCFFTRGIDSWYSVLSNLEHPNPSRAPLTPPHLRVLG